MESYPLILMVHDLRSTAYLWLQQLPDHIPHKIHVRAVISCMISVKQIMQVVTARHAPVW